MQFPQALETVLESLERMRDERTRTPCASRDALARLQRGEVAGAIVPNPQTPVRAELIPSKTNLVEERPPAAAEVARGRKAADASQPANAKARSLGALQERVCACAKCPNLAN